MESGSESWAKGNTEGEEVANWERETLPCPEGDNGVITR